MICPKVIYKNPITIQNNPTKIPYFFLQCSQQNTPPKTLNKISVITTKPNFLKPVITQPYEEKHHFSQKRSHFSPNEEKKHKKNSQKRKHFSQMSILCGFGYWVQGFRGLPWLALNFHMAQNLNINPSVLQLVCNTGMLPMVLKPFYGVFSDSVYISGAHRIPYVSIGVIYLIRFTFRVLIEYLMFVLEVCSWGPLALIPMVGETLPTLVACILLGNLGAAITEVSKDALVAEYGQNNQMQGLQSYAFMALAAGGLLGNLLGGYFLLKTQNPRYMFLFFTGLLTLQFSLALSTREDSLGLPQKKPDSESDSIRKQFSNLMIAIGEEAISRPLIWIVASILMVPNLSGSIFCFQTQCLNLNSSIIGMSKVTGQLMLISLTLLYDRFWKTISMRKLIGIAQWSYAVSLMLDLVLVKQINLSFGISNEVYALCFSGLAEIIAQFKLLPFLVLFAKLAPPGCEGSLTSFLASSLCLSSIISGFLGVGLASLLGIKSGDYSNLPVGIVIQFIAALVPLIWIYILPLSQPKAEKEKKKMGSKRVRRYRRVGRVVLDSVYAYRRERESEVYLKE